MVKSGEFTRDMRILPRPEVFDEQLQQDMLKKVDEAKKKIIEEVEKTNDGRCSIYIDLHPYQYYDATKLLKKWAGAFGYNLESYQDYNLKIKIFPKKDIWRKNKSKIMRLVKNWKLWAGAGGLVSYIYTVIIIATR